MHTVTFTPSDTDERRPTFLGRNGRYKCDGVNVSRAEETVVISPLTSRGLVGRCEIELPISEVPALVVALQKVSAGECRCARCGERVAQGQRLCAHCEMMGEIYGEDIL